MFGPWLWVRVLPHALQMPVAGQDAHTLKGEKGYCEEEHKSLGLCKHRFKS